MSMRGWTESGYGFALWNDNNFDKVKQFIVNHLDIFDMSDDWSKDILECDDDEYELEDILGEPVPWVIANIINTLEDTNVFKGYQSCGDTDQETMIGIEPMYPWSIERIWSQDTADRILDKYAKELGIEEEPDYFEAEYFG